MLKGFIKKADIILLVAILVIGIAASIIVANNEGVGDTVVIKLNGELYARYSLLEDRELVIEDGDNSNTVVIKNGVVSVTESNCHNQVCVQHDPIDASGQSIVCLPHKLVVSIEGEGGNEYDSVTN